VVSVSRWRVRLVIRWVASSRAVTAAIGSATGPFRSPAVGPGLPVGSCKELPVLIALVFSGCMSGPAGPVGGVE